MRYVWASESRKIVSASRTQRSDTCATTARGARIGGERLGAAPFVHRHLRRSRAAGMQCADRFPSWPRNVPTHPRTDTRPTGAFARVRRFPIDFSASTACDSSIARRCSRLSSGFRLQAPRGAERSDTSRRIRTCVSVPHDRRSEKRRVHASTLRRPPCTRMSVACFRLSLAIRSDTAAAPEARILTARRAASASRRSDTSAQDAGRICEFVIQY